MALDTSQDFMRLAGRVGMNTAKVESLRVHFIDDHQHTLRRQGLTIRVRESERSTELGLKLRRAAPITLPRTLNRLPGLSQELDALPGRHRWSFAIKSSHRRGRVAASGGSWLGCCSPDQQLFLATVIRGRALSSYDTAYGPILVRRLDGPAGDLARVTLERWTLPDGRRLLELSTKCRAHEAKATARAMRALVKRHRLTPSSCQRTKTEEAGPSRSG